MELTEILLGEIENRTIIPENRTEGWDLSDSMEHPNFSDITKNALSGFISFPEESTLYQRFFPWGSMEDKHPKEFFYDLLNHMESDKGSFLQRQNLAKFIFNNLQVTEDFLSRGMEMIDERWENNSDYSKNKVQTEIDFFNKFSKLFGSFLSKIDEEKPYSSELEEMVLWKNRALSMNKLPFSISGESGGYYLFETPKININLDCFGIKELSPKYPIFKEEKLPFQSEIYSMKLQKELTKKRKGDKAVMEYDGEHTKINGEVLEIELAKKCKLEETSRELYDAHLTYFLRNINDSINWRFRSIGKFAYFVRRLRQAKDEGVPVEFADLSDKPGEIKFDGMVNVGDYLNKRKLVENNFSLDSSQVMLGITGANGNGKSHYLEALRLNQLLFQAGLPSLISSGRSSLFSSIASFRPYIEFYADTESKLMKEIAHGKDLFNRTTDNSLIILDEAFSGTSLEEARQLTVDCTLSPLYHLARNSNSRVVFVTHNQEIMDYYSGKEGFVGGNFGLNPDGTPSYRIRIGERQMGSNAEELARTMNYTSEENMKRVKEILKNKD